MRANADGENVYITQKENNAGDYITVFGIHNCQLSSRISSDDALEETTAGETSSGDETQCIDIMSPATHLIK